MCYGNSFIACADRIHRAFSMEMHMKFEISNNLTKWLVNSNTPSTGMSHLNEIPQQM